MVCMVESYLGQLKLFTAGGLLKEKCIGDNVYYLGS